ncbi:MAG: hypothetical protein JXC35_01415 [Acholeplasmataceae bacterium]|nr:hypothetical protein [Acholeplasmataceae bacterium]
MYIHKKSGFTVIEAVAGIAIVSFVLISSITLLINILNQNKAQAEQLIAVQYATMIRDDIQIDLLITEGSSLILEDPLTSTNYALILSTLGITSIVINDAFDPVKNPYYDRTIITFVNQSINTTLGLDFVNFTVEIEYFSGRTLKIEGIIYG